MASADLFRSYLVTSLGADEMLVEVRLPAMPAGAGFAFEEFSRRHGDFAIVGITCMLIGEGGRCTAARLATAGTGPVPARLWPRRNPGARRPLDAAIDAAAARAAGLVTPDDDLHASSAYRRHLTRVLTGRALRRAITRMGSAASASPRRSGSP